MIKTLALFSLTGAIGLLLFVAGTIWLATKVLRQQSIAQG